MLERLKGLFKKNKQKTLDEYIEKKPPTEEKVPRSVNKIMKELERVAPKPISFDEISKNCDIPVSQLRTIFSRYSKFFDHVEKIDDGDTVKFRLDLKEKYGLGETVDQQKRIFSKKELLKKKRP